MRFPIATCNTFRKPFCGNTLRASKRFLPIYKSFTVIMGSRPTTPPAELSPGSESFTFEDRFEDTGATCEWVEEYRPGGFHPVNLGDTFRDGKYKVIRKLGDGSYSTVWLASNKDTPRYVALKIMVAKASTATTELSILDHLSKKAASDPRSQHLTILVDSFEHKGINGNHQCLVFEPMGSTAASFVEQLPENKPRVFGKAERYPPWMAKKILLHALRGLTFLHKNGVVHGDVQPGNLLFAIDKIALLEEDALKQDENDEDTVPVVRLDGKEDKWAPKNLYLKQPLYDHVEVGPQLCVKLSDLGAAFWSDNPPEDTVTPIGLRAPELIQHQRPLTSAIDMWSFGCLIFEFLTGRTLFAVGIFGRSEEDQNEADDDHLIQLDNIIEQLPDSMMALWPRAENWFGPGHVQKAPPGADEPYINDPLEKLFADNKHPDIDDEEAEVVCKLIRKILVYDPAKRPSAEEILEHPWFKE